MKENRPTLVDIFKSVLASFFGVQSDKNRQRDFQKGNPIHFIMVGVILTILFVLIIIGVIKLILYYTI